MALTFSQFEYRKEGERFVIFEPNSVCEGLGERAVAVTAGYYHADEDAARLMALAPELAAALKAAKGNLLNISIGAVSGDTKAQLRQASDRAQERIEAVLTKLNL